MYRFNLVLSNQVSFQLWESSFPPPRFSISCLKFPKNISYLIMTDFNVLFHYDPSHGLREGRGGQRARVGPIVIDVLREKTRGVELCELNHAVLVGMEI